MSVGLGGADSSALRFARSRGRTGSSADYGLQYPSPFFDIGQTYLPATIKQMFRWCRYYFLVNPLINAVVAKMADYPVTDIILDTEKPDLKDKWYHFLNAQLRYRPFQIELGLDYYAYGNALVSIFYPFVKMLRCKRCGHEKQASDATYRFQNFEFHWECTKCNHADIALVRDHYIKAPKGIRLLRWNPEDIDTRYNDITGESEYYYTIPVQIKNDIIMGKKSTVETMPQLFIDALRLRKAVVFSRDNIYHFKRPTLAGKDRGWGTPMILPVLKDTFYLQVLRKAQECVSLTTQIETINGLVDANEVRVGELVRTHTGKWQLVEKKWYRNAREEEVGKKITLSGLRPLSSTYSPHHPILSIRRTEESRRSDSKDAQVSSVILRNPHLYEEVLCPAEQLHVGEYVLYPRYLPVGQTTVDAAKYTGLTCTGDWVYSGVCEETAQAFESLEHGKHVQHDNASRAAKRSLKEGRTPKRMEAIRPMTEDLAYILGWYAGDGSCGSRSVMFSLGKDDDSNPLKEAIRREFGVEATVEVGESIDTIVLSDVIVRHLIKGLIPGTARHKKAPQEVLNGTDAVKLAYLRGLWEADGSFDLTRATLSTASKDQAYGVYRLLLHFGCIASINQHETPDHVLDSGRVIKGGAHYHTTACHASRDRFVSLLAGVKCEEITSGKSGFFWKEYFASRIHVIEESEEEQYIDFKIKEDTTFCTPGTATKNSIALEHIVPLRVLFPQAGSATSDPYCLASSSIVEANLGYEDAGKIKVGDLIKTVTGKYEPVTAVKKRRVRNGEKVYRIGVCGMSAAPVEPSEDHPFFVVKSSGKRKALVKDWRPDWVPVKDLQVGDYVAYPLSREIKKDLQVDIAQYLKSYVATEDWVYRQITQEGAKVYEYVEQREQRAFAGGELQSTVAKYGWSVSTLQTAASRYRRGHRTSRLPRFIKWSKELATIVGYYLAEGSCGDHIIFSLNASEDWICDELDAAFMAILGHVGARRPKGENGLTYEMNDSIFAEFLTNFLGHLAPNKRLPKEVVHLPDEILQEIVRCLINGDGGAEQGYRDNGTGNPCRTSAVTFTSTSRDLSFKLRELLLYLRVIGRVHTTTYATGPNLPVHRVKINGAEAVKLWTMLGWKVPALPVKKDCTRSFILGDYAFFRIQKKEEIQGVEFVYGFQVDGDKSFCVPACATHNTSVNLMDWHDQIAGELRRWRCITPESFVETREGLRQAGNVGVGDYLKNRHGKFERVTKRHDRAMDAGECAYRLKVRGQHAVDTVYSEEHPIWAAKKINNGNGHKLGTADFIPVAELSPGDYVGYPTARNINKVERLDLAEYVDRAVTADWVYIDHTDQDVPEIFEYLSTHGEIDSRKELLEEHGWGLNSYKCAQAAIREGRVLRRVPRYLYLDQELAYVLGLYAAEGNTTAKGVFFSLHKDETAFVDRLDSFFALRFGASRTGGDKSENGIQIAYPSVVAAQLFHALIPGTAINKSLPDVIKCAPDDIAAAALRGVLDGDGSYYEDKTVLGVSSRQLAEDARQLLLSWQILPGISFVKGQDITICGKKTRGNGCYLVQVSGDAHKQLSAVLAGEVYSGSTFSRIGLFRDGFAWFRIEEVTKVEVDTVVAFQMEGDSTFCTWGVATHNSDNNYIPILPLPIGQQTIGGDGRALLLSQEIRVWSEHIIAGMGVPTELIFGGLSYSGSNVSLRMLENMFLGYLSDQLALLRWVIKRTASYLGWSEVGARFKPFKMADDLQRKAYLFQLNQAGKISDESLCSDADYDSAKEDKIMENEATRRIGAMKKQRLLQAEMEGEAQLVQQKWINKAQAKALADQTAIAGEGAKDQMAFQAEMQQGMLQDQVAAQTGQAPPPKSPDMTPTPRNPSLIAGPKEINSPLSLQSVQRHPPSATNEDIAGGMNVDLLFMARKLADKFSRLNPGEKPVMLSRLQKYNPALHDTVVGLMMSGGNGPTAASQAAARPLPLQRTPRRGPEAAQV